MFDIVYNDIVDLQHIRHIVDDQRSLIHYNRT